MFKLSCHLEIHVQHNLSQRVTSATQPGTQGVCVRPNPLLLLYYTSCIAHVCHLYLQFSTITIFPLALFRHQWNQQHIPMVLTPRVLVHICTVTAQSQCLHRHKIHHSTTPDTLYLQADKHETVLNSSLVESSLVHRTQTTPSGQHYSPALIINLEDLVVKQAFEQSGHVPKSLWLARPIIYSVCQNSLFTA